MNNNVGIVLALYVYGFFHLIYADGTIPQCFTMNKDSMYKNMRIKKKDNVVEVARNQQPEKE
jgi:hypothetical protein